MATKNGKRIQWLAQLALLTAVTVVLELATMPVKFGPFHITFALVPIVIGGAVLGAGAGAWLGAAFGAVVLLSGEAAAFLAFSVPGTVVTVMVKGVGAGLAAGAVYRVLRKKQNTAALCAAMAAPVANSGLFIAGCYLFFLPLLEQWAAGWKAGSGVTKYIFLGLVGLNFVVEFASVALLSGVIVRIIHIWKGRN